MRILFLFLILFSTTLHAQTMTWEEIEQRIRQANGWNAVYDHAITALQEEAHGAKSWMPPQVGVGQFMTPYQTKLWKATDDEKGMGNVMLSIEQMLPNFAQRKAEIQLAQQQHKPMEQEKKATIFQQVQEGKQYYVAWVMLKKRKKIVDENQRILRAMQAIAEKRVGQNKEKLATYYQTNAMIGKMKAEALSIQTETRNVHRKLCRLMGQDYTPFDVDTVYVLKEFNPANWSGEQMQQRYDIQQLNAEIELTQRKREVELQKTKPQFGIQFNHMIGFGKQPPLYTLMGTMKLPGAKWSRSMSESVAQSLASKTKELEATRAYRVQEYVNEANIAWEENQSWREQVNIYEQEILPALQRKFHVTMAGYEQNTEELMSVFAAWQDLNATKLDYIGVLEKTYQAQIQIETLQAW